MGHTCTWVGKCGTPRRAGRAHGRPMDANRKRRIVMRLIVGTAGVLGLLLAAARGVPAQQPADALKLAYAKTEYPIAMRDGVKLFTAVYAPRDASKPLPILLNRTPYSVAPYG